MCDEFGIKFLGRGAMFKKLPILILAILLLNCGCYITGREFFLGFPRNAYKEVTVKDVTFTPGSTLLLDTQNGNIEVTSWDKEEAKIEATKKVYAPSEKEATNILEQINIDISTRGNKVIIETKVPKMRIMRFYIIGVDISYNNIGVSYRITVPKEANLILRTNNGRIAVSQINGDVEAKTNYANIEIRYVKGNVNLKTYNGEVYLESVQGNIEGETQYARMGISNIEGDIKAKNYNGSICIEKAEGNVKGKTSYARMEISNIIGNVEAENYNGGIHIRNVKGDVYGETKYAKIQMANINGNIEAKNYNGEIYLEGIKGNNIEGETSYNKIECEIDTLSEPSTISFKNYNGGIELYIPEIAELAIYCKTRNGRVDSDFPIFTKRSALKGKVIITLETAYGNIYIRRKQ